MPYGQLFQHHKIMQRLLIILGLIIVPFYEIFLHVLPYAASHAPDSRVTKEELALVFALSIGLLAVWHGEIKPFRNKFLLIIPVYLLFNLIMAPHAPLTINNNEVGDFYFWKPFAEVLCFTFMIIAVSSMEINFEEILKIMVWCGFIMAIYVILQRFGLDQFWVAKGYNYDGAGNSFIAVRSEELGGNLGQPTIVASWMVMMVPLAFYFRKWWMGITITVACSLTQGVMVGLALATVGMVSAIRYDRLLILPVGLILVASLMFGISHTSQIINRMDGRYEVWKDTLSDIKNGQIDDKHKFSITGVGLGRFSFLFPGKHKITFQQTHNDPMEFAYDCGIFGEYLLLVGIFVMLAVGLFHVSSLVFSIALSFLAIFVCSLGSFPFQLGAHQFYAATLVGLLHNEKIIRRV